MSLSAASQGFLLPGLVLTLVLQGCGGVEENLASADTVAAEICSLVESRYSDSVSGRARSEIYEVDGSVVARLSRPSELFATRRVWIDPGTHVAVVSCWRRLETDAEFFRVEFDAVAAHHYAANCEIGGDRGACRAADWWVEIIDVNTGGVVAKSDIRRRR